MGVSYSNNGAATYDGTLTAKERVKIPRQAMPEQHPAERVNNWDEVNLGFSETMAITEAQRCLLCENPLCLDGCPIGVQIPDFIRLIAGGNFSEAAEILAEDNPLPAVCGRVCPQESLCEGSCVLSRRYEPVAIGHLERFAADYAREWRDQPIPGAVAPTGKKIAIVGSGPAGLACAYDLLRKGHEVTIFEALHDFGGVLVYGIPEFRLPRNILRHEIRALGKMGARFVKNTVIGKTIAVDDLLERDGFDAIFIGVGAGLPWFMDIPGENLNGVYSANEFLTRVNLMNAHDFPNHDTPVKLASSAVIIGGGNTAMDAARAVRRLGAVHTTIIYRRSEDEMPARTEELCHAKNEGIEFVLLAAPVTYMGDSGGWLQNVECIRMKLGEPDESGRRRPVEIKGSNFAIEADMVIVAIGNGSNPLIGRTTPDLKINQRGNIVVDPATGSTNMVGVFAGGDIVTGGATVIQAMGAGRQAAEGIHAFVTSAVSLEAD